MIRIFSISFMAATKIDFKIRPKKRKPSNDGRVTVAVPKNTELAYYKIPKKDRNDLMREIVEAFVKENAS